MYQDKLLFQAETVQLLGGEYELVMQDHSYLSAQRKAMGLSQQMVASAAGIDLRQYQRLESGERSMCSASLRIGLAICDVLGLDPHRFVPTRPQVQTDPADGHQYINVEKRLDPEADRRMKKFKVFRSLGKVNEDVKKHELVAVEYGQDIHAVTDKLIKAVNDDAAGLPQFEKGYTACSMPPEERPSDRRIKRYQYSILAIMEPDFGDSNELLEYGIMVEEMDPRMEHEQLGTRCDR